MFHYYCIYNIIYFDFFEHNIFRWYYSLVTRLSSYEIPTVSYSFIFYRSTSIQQVQFDSIRNQVQYDSIQFATQVRGEREARDSRRASSGCAARGPWLS